MTQNALFYLKYGHFGRSDQILEVSDLRDPVNKSQMLASHFDAYTYQWGPNPKALSPNYIWIQYFMAIQKLGKEPVFTEALEPKSEPRI